MTVPDSPAGLPDWLRPRANANTRGKPVADGSPGAAAAAADGIADAEPAHAAAPAGRTSQAGADTTIPMLTDILGDPLAAAVAPRLAPGVADAGRGRLVRDFEAGVLARVQRRVDALIADSLDETLNPLIELYTERLIEELCASLRQTIREAVDRALGEELARLHQAGAAPDAGPLAAD